MRSSGTRGSATASARPRYTPSASTPPTRGGGIGELLLSDILAEADRRQSTVFLEVRVDNDPAIGLYKKHGFVQLGVRKNYYQPPVQTR